MVARKKEKPETGKLAREFIEREDGIQEIPPRQSLTSPTDGTQSSANSPDHPNKANHEPLMKALGTTSRDFVEGLVGQLIDASARSGDLFDGQELFFNLAVVTGRKPADDLVAMHVAQMAAVHTAAMRASGELGRAEDLPRQESATRALTQLTRTYTAQLEALKRYQSGEQKPTVQNVSVTEGGQAIVGNVTQAAASPQEHTAAPALKDAPPPVMEINAAAERVPVPLRAKGKA